jgi:hypothetical protein
MKPRTPSSSCRVSECSWLGNTHSSSAFDIALCAVTKATWSRRRSQSAANPLQRRGSAPESVSAPESAPESESAPAPESAPESESVSAPESAPESEAAPESESVSAPDSDPQPATSPNAKATPTHRRPRTTPSRRR